MGVWVHGEGSVVKRRVTTVWLRVWGIGKQSSLW